MSRRWKTTKALAVNSGAMPMPLFPTPTAEGDRTQLGMPLQNLLTNAV
ncbi:hypothetical protein P3L51_02860 [Streptomyces sp. PSRA5]